MGVAHTLFFLCCVILAPLLVHLRQWKPAGLFAAAALVYAIFGVTGFSNVPVSLSRIQEAGPQIHDTYYVVNSEHASLGLGIIMAFFAAVTWLQDRFGALLYPRTTKTLFWVLHLGLIWASSLSMVLTFFVPPPRRYTEYSEYAELFYLVSTWASVICSVAVLGLLGVFLGSTIKVWQESRKN